MPFRLGGLNSGMDTDSVVKAMMASQTLKKTNIEGKKQKLEWKKELWSDMNTKIYNFYKSSLSKMRFSSAFSTKSATSSEASKVKATAGTSASAGTYKVKVNSAAASQYVTSGKLAGAVDENGDTVAVSQSTKLKDIVGANFATGTQIHISAKNGANNVFLEVNDDTTVNDFVKAAKNTGLNASFDETQQRFFIGAADSGVDQKFTITAGQLSSSQQDAISEWMDAVGYQHLSGDDQVAVKSIFNGLQAGTTTYDDKVEESLKNYLGKAQENAVTNYYKEQITASYNNKYFSDADHKVFTQEGKDALIAAGKYNDVMTDGDVAVAIAALVSTKVSEAMASDTVKNEIAAAVTAGVTAGTITDSTSGESWNIATPSDAFLSDTSSTRESKILSVAQNYHTTMSSVAESNSVLNALGMTAVDGTAVAEGADSAGIGMVVVEGKDASITFNGATLTSKNSTITVNGLSLEILGDTEGKEVTITVNKDTSAIYDSIKDFISEYNDILKAMNTSYNAESASSYAMLTDEMKESMSEDEIEKWNNKIKSSLLRRDTTLNSLISSFRNNVMGSVTASNGKTYSLASIGISTSTDYKEGGLLHIRGDEDDSVYGDYDNTLQKMLDEDPDTVMEVITNLAGKLYSDLTKKMSKTSLSSALTFYNNVDMDKQITSYKKEISQWEKKLSDLETRYYAQFSAMEKSLANLNSQSNSLSGFFG